MREGRRKAERFFLYPSLFVCCAVYQHRPAFLALVFFALSSSLPPFCNEQTKKQMTIRNERHRQRETPSRPWLFKQNREWSFLICHFTSFSANEGVIEGGRWVQWDSLCLSAVNDFQKREKKRKCT
mmetsp:Transcript_41092/g.81077  ORF Transcript_41092/g.81077 Transcript_41092/m.81077 type:complete len:126 (+) Transcript_41092:870-1247(+)